MATSGANVTFGNTRLAYQEALEVLGLRPDGWEKKRDMVCVKAGAPVTNTVGDDPLKKGVLCFDTTNKDVYLCTAYTSAAVHVWTKLN